MSSPPLSTPAVPSLARRAGSGAGAALLALAAGATDALLPPILGTDGPQFWLFTGVAMVALQGRRPWALPGLVAAALVLAFHAAGPVATALVSAASHLAGAALIVALLTRWGVHPPPRTATEAGRLNAALAVGMLVPALADLALLAGAGEADPGRLLAIAGTNWVADMVGLLIAGPLLGDDPRVALAPLRRRPARFALLLAASCLAALVPFGLPPWIAPAPLPLSFVVFPFLVVAAIRFGAVGSSLVVLVVALLAAHSTASGTGRFGPEAGMLGGAVLLWLYVAVMTIMGLALAGMEEARAEADRRLRDSEELHRLLYTYSADAIIYASPSGEVYAANAEACRILGRSEAEICAAGRDAVVIPNDPVVAAGLDRRERTGSFAGELSLRRGDGSTFPAELHSRLFTDSRGRRRSLVQFRDLSAQQRAAQALHESNERLADAEALASLGHWDWDEATQTLHCSAGFFRLFGEDVHAPGVTHVVDWNAWLARVHPEDAASVRAALRRVRSTPGRHVWQARFVRGGDDVRHVEMTATPTLAEDGRLLRVFGTAMDISELVATLAALYESQRRLATIVDNAMEAIVAVDETGRIAVWNRAAETLFGCSAGDAMGAEARRFLPALDVALAPTVPREDAAPLLRLDGVRADGGRVPLEASTSSVELDGRRLATLLIRDVTERLQAEAARTALEGQLAEAQKLEAIGTLAGGIAHDFNNIIGAILGNVELAREDLPAGHPSTSSVEEIRKAGVRARDLVEQILAFSRRGPREKVELHLAEAVRDAVGLLRPLLPGNARLDVLVIDENCVVAGDASQVHQAVVNLCMNSWQALDGRPGKVSVVVDRADVGPAEAARHGNLRAGRYARVTVADNGVGMDEQTLSRIFEPFFTTHRGREGTGLGLAVVHGIMRGHDGAVTVQSVPGEGSTFRLYFPLATLAAPPPPAAPAQPARQVTADAARPLHVLYVDDDEALVFLVERLLSRRGFRVTSMQDPDEALALLDAGAAFDAVVTDYNMPGRSGLDVAQHVRARRPGLPVIMTSGYVSDDLRGRARDAGVVDLLYKPDTVDALVAALVRALAPAAENRTGP